MSSSQSSQEQTGPAADERTRTRIEADTQKAASLRAAGPPLPELAQQNHYDSIVHSIDTSDLDTLRTLLADTTDLPTSAWRELGHYAAYSFSSDCTDYRNSELAITSACRILGADYMAHETGFFTGSVEWMEYIDAVDMAWADSAGFEEVKAGILKWVELGVEARFVIAVQRRKVKLVLGELGKGFDLEQLVEETRREDAEAEGESDDDMDDGDDGQELVRPKDAKSEGGSDE